MRKLLTVAVTSVALVPLLVATSASARPPLEDRDLITTKQAASVYPGLAGGDRLKGRYSIVAPRFATVGGRLKCDRYQKFPGVRRRSAFFFNVKVERSVDLGQSVVRFRTVKRAKSLMRHYRKYIRTCRGTHPTTDGEGGRARMKVRPWSTPHIGGGSVGMLDAFIQDGFASWTRTVVARTGRTVSLQDISYYTGKGGPKRAIRISRKAIGKLA